MFLRRTFSCSAMGGVHGTSTQVMLRSQPSGRAQEVAPLEHPGKPLAFWPDRLQAKDIFERDEAIQVFSRIGMAGQKAAPLLRPLLKDADLRTRLEAALTLWAVQGDGKDSVATLREDFPKLSPQQKEQLWGYVGP